MINPSRSTRVWLAVAALALAGSVASGQVGPRSNVVGRTALFDALLVALQQPGRFVVQMGGESMRPFFGPGSIGVVQPVAPERLRPGMIAVYRNRQGEFIAHCVVARQGDGWSVCGLNNSRPDSVAVDGSNLQGVLYATFHTAGSTLDSGAPLAGLPVVLGAPAK